MDPALADESAMDRCDNGHPHANGTSSAMEEVADSTAEPNYSAPAAAAAAAALPTAVAADRVDSSDLTLTLFKWDDKHHRQRNWVQHKPPQLVREKSEATGAASAAAASAASSSVPLSCLPADAPVLSFSSSSEWGTDEDDNLRDSCFVHSEFVPPTPDGKSKPMTRQRKIYVCLLCENRYKRSDRYLKHVQSHELSPASMLAELQRQTSHHSAESMHEAESGEDEPRFYAESVQVVVQYRCKLCQPEIILYEKLAELSRHVLVDHLGKSAPALLSCRPQHRSSVRAPVLRSLGQSNSDDEHGGGGDDDDDGPNDAAAHGRTKHTPSRFSKSAAGGTAAAGSNARKRKSIASTSAGPDEDGCAVAHGVTCADCAMVFASENDAFRKHRQGHLRYKYESSLAQQHMTDEQRAAHEATHPEQTLQLAAAAGGRGGPLLVSKPLTRAQLAAISKRSDDDDEKADKDEDSDAPQRMRRNPASGTSLVTQPLSSPDLSLSCDGCQRVYSRRSALNRHIRANKCKGATEANGRNCNSEEDDSSDGDDGSDGEFHDDRRPDRTLYYCKYCPHVARSRTSFYTHRKKCEHNPEVQGAAAAAAPAPSQGTMEQMHDGESAAAAPSKPPLHRQRSAEKSASSSKHPARPAMQRSQTEPMSGSAAAAAAHTPKGADRFAAKDLICPQCNEVFTHPFSVSRHMSVHPDANSKGTIYTCKHCRARFGHSQRFHKHEQHCATRLAAIGHTSSAVVAAAAAASNGVDESESSPRSKRARKSASSSTEANSRPQSGSSTAAAAASDSLSSQHPMMDAEEATARSAPVGDHSSDSNDSRGNTLTVHAALKALKVEPMGSSSSAAAAQPPWTNEAPLSMPMQQLSSLAPPATLATALPETPIRAPPAPFHASTIHPLSFAPAQPTGQNGSIGWGALGNESGSQLSFGFSSLPPFPQTVPQSQPHAMGSANSDIDGSSLSFCIRGIGLRPPETPSAAASLGAVSSSALSPASMEVALTSSSLLPLRTDSDRALTTGSFSPATTAFNAAKMQAASAPGKRAASMKKKVGWEVTDANQTTAAVAVAERNPAAAAASASTVPASASTSLAVPGDSDALSAAAPSATAAACVACPMCSASFSALNSADQRAHRRRCLDRLVRLSISQRSDTQKRLIEQERQWVKQSKQQAAGSDVPASAASFQPQLPQSWRATPTPCVPPKLTASIEASARPSLAAPTPSAATAAGSAAARLHPHPPLLPLSKYSLGSDLSPRVQPSGSGSASAYSNWPVKKTRNN